MKTRTLDGKTGMGMVAKQERNDIVARLAELIGSANVLTAADQKQRSSPWQTDQPCNAKALLLPGDTAELAAVLRTCNDLRQPVVPYGGLTNLTHACVTTADDVAIAFDRMNVVEEVDSVGHTMTVQAGVTMLEAQLAAERNGLFFPVDIGARDSCTIGGNVSTNAGGTKVIRYGMMRDSVLGLEAVLADGTVVSSMNHYIKNNSGLDLKQLFIGAEGLLGVVSRIVLRLDVQPRTHHVALLACSSFDDIAIVLNKAKQALGATLCGFEVMWDSFFDRATTPVGNLESPFESRHPIYAIVESMGVSSTCDEQLFEGALEDLWESGHLVDAIIAKSDRERDAIWAIRHEVEWLVRDALNFDVSLRTRDVQSYVDTITARIVDEMPGTLVATFGHLGDNNLHVSVLPATDKNASKAPIERHVYESLRPFNGAISAEHGIGMDKKPWLAVSRSPQEIALMVSLKQSLDPNGILNPGKVFEIH